LNSFSRNEKFNGNILIAEKGKVIYKKSFGFSNETTKEKLNENSIFELASVSKQFTAMAIVILKEKGQLKYDDKISKYIPELKAYNITIRNLLNHTGGLPDYKEVMDSVFDKSKIATNKDVISIFAQLKPEVLFEPNTKWEYSNTGYALLASIIEKVSGMS
jgi:CubicO group peptidase (beta-lactamase class C family)